MSLCSPFSCFIAYNNPKTPSPITFYKTKFLNPNPGAKFKPPLAGGGGVIGTGGGGIGGDSSESPPRFDPIGAFVKGRTFSCFIAYDNPKTPTPITFYKTKFLNPKPGAKFHPPRAGGGGVIGTGGGYGGGGGRGDSSEDESSRRFDPIGAFVKGWKDRVDADSQFPFKVVMEELVGVSACILGDMVSRPNFGLNELDFVFSSLIVCSILNFLLMYILAPTSSSSIQHLPSIFAKSPTSHMFEPGPYSLFNRVGTFVYKGGVFACAGFGAGLVGTAISNGLIMTRKKIDPSFEPPNKAPPMLLNAFTWAAQLGISSNLRYQSLNGIEFLLAKMVPPYVFKSSVMVLRCLNNVAGGMSFVTLARFTGSQSVSSDKSEVL